MENLFNHYERNFKSCLENQNDDIVRMFNESIKSQENLDKLSYNEHRKIGVDYYDITKKLFNDLNVDLNNQIDLKISAKQVQDKNLLYRMVFEMLINLKQTYEENYDAIINRLYLINTTNKSIKNFQANYKKMVNDYFKYLNYAFCLNDNSKSRFLLLQNIVHDRYNIDFKLHNSLIDRYGYVDREMALVIYLIIFRIYVKILEYFLSQIL
jgi:hypothetical protein